MSNVCDLIDQNIIKAFLYFSSHAAELDGAVVVRLLQDHGRRHRADRREPAEASVVGHLLVPESHRRGPRVHRLRPQQPGGADA